MERKTDTIGRGVLLLALALATACAWAEDQASCTDKKSISDAWFKAAEAGKVETMIDLLSRCRSVIGDVDIRDGQGRTARMIAAERNNVSVMQFLSLVAPQKEEAAGAAVSTSTKDTRVANNPRGAHLAEDWHLGEDAPIDRLQPYRPMYLIGRLSSHVDQMPTSPAPGRTVTTSQDFQPTEAKFQLSFKAEAISPQFLKEHLHFERSVRVWIAYTQQSNWQAFNGPRSSPFRETNYEPEAIVSFDTRDKAGTGLNPELVNVGFMHQSNGRSNPESRSWNRIYLQGGWQLSRDVAFMPRLWVAGQKDDNPDIGRYQRADATLRIDGGRRWGQLELLGRHNLNLGHSRGFLQADWGVPLRENGAMFHLQLTTGYGESLLDYNWRQTTFGLGFSFWDW